MSKNAKRKKENDDKYLVYSSHIYVALARKRKRDKEKVGTAENENIIHSLARKKN